MEYSLDKYKYFVHNNEVIAVSTYAGKTVRGIAKCNPEDAFDLEKGKVLAAARCNAKVAEKRFKRAKSKCEMTFKAYTDAVNAHNKMVDYYEDSERALAEAKAAIDNLMEQL